MSAAAIVALGDVTMSVMGQAPPGSACNKNGEGTIFVKAGEFSEKTPLVREWTTKPLKLAKQGDVLVCVVGATAGKVNRAIDCAIGRSVAAVRPDDRYLETEYLYHFLLTHVQELRRKSQGLAQGVVTREMLSELTIPLPSLDEQRRIAANLNKADALRRKCKHAIGLLDKLNQSIFFDMFARKASDDWQIVKVEDIAKDIRTGPFGSQLLHSEFTEDGIAVLGIDNAVENEFRWSQKRYISEDKYKTLKRFTVYPGDVLITIMGTCGRCAIVPQDIPVAINTKHLCCATLDRRKCLPEFLHAAFLNDPGVQRQLGVQAKGAVMPGLNMGIIKSLHFRLPPITAQQLYSERISAIRRASNLMVNQLDKFEEIFASLQKHAFPAHI